MCRKHANVRGQASPFGILCSLNEREIEMVLKFYHSIFRDFFSKRKPLLLLGNAGDGNAAPQEGTSLTLQLTRDEVQNCEDCMAALHMSGGPEVFAKSLFDGTLASHMGKKDGVEYVSAAQNQKKGPHRSTAWRHRLKAKAEAAKAAAEDDGAEDPANAAASAAAAAAAATSSAGDDSSRGLADGAGSTSSNSSPGNPANGQAATGTDASSNANQQAAAGSRGTDASGANGASAGTGGTDASSNASDCLVNRVKRKWAGSEDGLHVSQELDPKARYVGRSQGETSRNGSVT